MELVKIQALVQSGLSIAGNFILEHTKGVSLPKVILAGAGAVAVTTGSAIVIKKLLVKKIDPQEERKREILCKLEAMKKGTFLEKSTLELFINVTKAIMQGAITSQSDLQQGVPEKLLLVREFFETDDRNKLLEFAKNPSLFKEKLEQELNPQIAENKGDESIELPPPQEQQKGAIYRFFKSNY